MAATLAKTALPDYSVVTERPGDRVTAEALRMFHTRYDFARRFCERKDLLELGCGAGLGLAYLAQYARHAVGADSCATLLHDSSSRANTVPLVCLDAHALPFREQSLDVVVIFEAIYYFADPGTVLSECKRILRPGGVLLICLANCHWPGFHPSPFSKQYFPASELHTILVRHHFQAQLYGAFPGEPANLLEKLRDGIRRTAVRWQLIPISFKAKARLKKLFYGRLESIAPLSTDTLQVAPLFPICPDEQDCRHRVLFALARPVTASTPPEQADFEQVAPLAASR